MLGAAVTDPIVTPVVEVIAAVAVAVHPPTAEVPVTVYVVVVAGVALTDVPLVADNPADGDQEYENAVPDAVNPIAVPGLQYVADVGETDTVGVIFTVTVTGTRVVDGQVAVFASA